MANNLRFLRRQSGLSLQELADKTGASASLLYKIENGERTLDKWKSKLASALECHPDDLDTYDLGVGSKALKAELSGFLGAGGIVYPLELGATDHMAEATRMPAPSMPKSAHMLEVKSSNALEGFVLFYDARFPGVPQEFLHKLCVLWLEDGTCVIRRPEKGSGPGRFHLRSFHPSDMPLKNVIVAHCALITHMVQR